MTVCKNARTRHGPVYNTAQNFEQMRAFCSMLAFLRAGRTLFYLCFQVKRDKILAKALFYFPNTPKYLS
jgi:hypothetical protein